MIELFNIIARKVSISKEKESGRKNVDGSRLEFTNLDE